VILQLDSAQEPRTLSYTPRPQKKRLVGLRELGKSKRQLSLKGKYDMVPSMNDTMIPLSKIQFISF
jgi:hypothetical protein